ncbi:hypothetical protein [Paraburkholderia xenovorans]|uniref:hypothetical protein n=1 Tax=Paraburkholderia xenovorans TaxID=36873 RepID=UPI0038B9BE54
MPFENLALRVTASEAGDFVVEAARERLAGRDQQFGHADDVGIRAGIERCVRRDAHVIGGDERGSVARHDAGAMGARPGVPSTMRPQSRPADMNMSYMPYTTDADVSGSARMQMRTRARSFMAVLSGKLPKWVWRRAHARRIVAPSQCIKV